MVSIEQVRSLVQAYLDRDDVRFKTVVLQIAASEAKQGDAEIARELKDASCKIPLESRTEKPASPEDGMFVITHPKDHLRDLVVPEDVEEKMQRILQEFRNQNRLRKFGLLSRRKILMEGPSGTGKAFSASVIASELSLPLYLIRMDEILSDSREEAREKKRQIFREMESVKAVYLFDASDVMGEDQSPDHETGKAGRILHSFLQFMEEDRSESLMIVTASSQKLLNPDLRRRFDEVLQYRLPKEEEIRKLYLMKLDAFISGFTADDALVRQSMGLCHAEIIRVCDDAMKASILSGEKITTEQLPALVEERKRICLNQTIRS